MKVPTIPAACRLTILLIGYSVTGLTLQNIVPTAQFLTKCGVLVSDDIPFDKVVKYLNLSLSFGLLSSLIIQYVSTKFGGIKFLCSLWFGSFIGGMLLVLIFPQNKFLVRFGIISCGLVFPSSNLTIPSIYQLFPGKEYLICAINSALGDFSAAIIPLLLFIHFKWNIECLTLAYTYVICIVLPLAIESILCTPRWGERTWRISEKQNKNNLSSENVNERDGYYGAGRRPLYHSQSFLKIAMSPQYIMYILVLLPHFLRMKKVINPYIDKILSGKASEEGMTDLNEYNYVLNLFLSVPGFAWIATILYGLLVMRTSNVKAFLIANVLSSIGYVALYAMPWSRTSLIFSAITYAFNTGCCFGSAISYCQELAGPLNVSYASATIFVVHGIVGLIWDLLYPIIVDGVFNSNYFSSLQLINIMSLFSVVINVLLLFMPPPGLLDEKWDGHQELPVVEYDTRAPPPYGTYLGRHS